MCPGVTISLGQPGEVQSAARAGPATSKKNRMSYDTAVRLEEAELMYMKTSEVESTYRKMSFLALP